MVQSSDCIQTLSKSVSRAPFICKVSTHENFVLFHQLQFHVSETSCVTALRLCLPIQLLPISLCFQSPSCALAPTQATEVCCAVTVVAFVIHFTEFGALVSTTVRSLPVRFLYIIATGFSYFIGTPTALFWCAIANYTMGAFQLWWSFVNTFFCLPFLSPSLRLSLPVPCPSPPQSLKFMLL